MFVRKAKEYRSKGSGGSDSSGGRSRSKSKSRKYREHYRLKDVTHGKDMFAPGAPNKSASEESVFPGDVSSESELRKGLVEDDIQSSPASLRRDMDTYR